METLYIYLLGILFVYCVYVFGKFFIAMKLGLHDREVFLGFGNYSAIKLKFKTLTVHIGLFIPLPFFAQFYSYHNGLKRPITYEWQFFDRPWYARVFAAFGGAFSALMISILIFTLLAYFEKDTYLSKEELNKHGVFPSKLAYEAGFRKGDKILRINGNDYERWSEIIAPGLITNDATTYQVSRNGTMLELSVSLLEYAESGTGEYLFYPNTPFKVGAVTPGEAADLAGMLKGDVIKSINGRSVVSFCEAREYFQEFSNESVLVGVLRDGHRHSFEVGVNGEGKIGFFPKMEMNYTSKSRSVISAVVLGFERPFSIIGTNIKAFGKVFSGNIDSKKNINGPVAISGLFDSGIRSFFNVTAILLVAIFLWDFLPLPKSAALKSIPVMIEVIFKKKVSLQVYNTIYKGGWALIMLMMIGTLINDVLKLL